jgi:hypothetical protein
MEAHPAAAEQLVDEPTPAPNEPDDCPICLSPGMLEEPLLRTHCGHEFCQPCIERVITTTKSFNPTRAPCPVCRAELSLFGLALPSGVLLHPKEPGCAALAGKVFVQMRTVGLASYHFPEELSPDDAAFLAAPEPYLCYESGRVDEYEWTLDNGRRPPQRKHFAPGCHWHAATRTFHGTALWEEGWYGSKRWDYVMQFSSDFRYICGGGVSMHREATAMDGRWRVCWDSGEMATIDIVAGAWALMGAEYQLDLSSGDAPFFLWPPPRGSLAPRVKQRLTAVVDAADALQDPPVGSTVVWETNSADHPTIKWVRESKSERQPPPLITPFGPRGLAYVQWHSPTQVGGEGTAPPERAAYCGETLWGNVFVQGMRAGLASYHFVPPALRAAEGAADLSIGTAYISYEHPHCAQWPPLDDGSPVPARVPFEDLEWDAQTRTFRGTVDWQSTYGTTWQGVDKWEYTMVFDNDFTCVKQGSCMATVAGAEPHEQSRFGVSLIYVNAAAEECFESLLRRDPATLPAAPDDTQLLQGILADGGAEAAPAADILAQVRALQQGLGGALVPGLGLDDLSERLSRHLTSSGASARTSAVLLQLLTAAHVRGAAQATAQPEDDVVGERVVAPEGALQSAADRLLYTQEAIDEIDAALEWAGLELAAEDGGSPDLAGLAAVEDLADALIAAEEEDAV